MKILAINGSHRKGNTQFMLQTILQTIKQKNPSIQVKQINLRQHNIQYCIDNDYYCTKVQNCECCRDDMKNIYQLMINSDLIIFGSPTYFFSVSARMKTFLQRCNPFWYNKLLKNKSCYLIGVGGNQQKNIEGMIQYMKLFAQKSMEMNIIGSYITRKQQINGVEKDDKVKANLKQIGIQLTKVNLNK